MIGIKILVASAAIVLASCLLGILLTGCEGSTKRLVGEYRLERFNENGKYYLVDSKDESGGGVFDGTIDQIGWSQDWILAQVIRLYHGDANGWYALNVKTKQVTGPLSESDIKSNPALSGIAVRSCSDAIAGKGGS